MKNYLSFGGGVNSVAMYLLLLDQGVEFEAIFVDHSTDWPETYAYVGDFAEVYPLTILKPEYKANDGKIYNDLLSYYKSKGKHPVPVSRNCTNNFKIKPIYKYCTAPAFMMIGYAYDERHRAKISSNEGFEYRYPLIESEISRAGCIEIIEKHGLPVPPKSGCYFCPFQSIADYRRLRVEHPDLFCVVDTLEKNYASYLKSKNKIPYYLKGRKKPVRVLINENQMSLFEEEAYPPCECML